MSVKLFKSNEITMHHRGGPPGTASVGRAVDSQTSNTMGAGLAFFDQCSVAWTVLYDEVIFVHSGIFRLRVEDHIYEGKAGDILWIPKGTALSYEGESASIFYVVYPGNWKEIEGVN